ncbi:MAG TPA: serine hydrolase, partial [Candidatus Angelobacter sp.]|nr:serine hydrolase [Candidatus Angelobacter sp.]
TVARLMRAADVTGVGITLFNHGQVAYQKTYGVRDKDKNLPLTEDSVTTAASFTKVAFAYLVMQLVEAKTLDLDKPVYKYLPKPLPEYPKYKDLAGDPRYQRITTRMLLDHTSGFPNFRWLNDDHKLNINFEPGSRYAYSGEGIELLQLVVETVTKQPLEELMRQHIFRPLGMTRTSMVWQTKFDTDYANGYDEWGRSLGPEKWQQADAAGSMQTTLADFSRFMQAMMQGRGLRKETRDLMLSPQVQIASKHEFPTLASETTEANKPIQLSYGLGWGLYQTPYGKAFFKEGHADGFRNYTVCFDKDKTGIVIMTNSSNGEGIYKELLETLLKNTFTPIEWEGFAPYDQLPPRPPLKQHKEIALSPNILDKYSGRYSVSPDLIVIVVREGNHLTIKEGAENHEIFPESERDFFSKTADDEITFEVNSQGQVTGMVLRTGGRTMPIKRIE